MRAGLLGKMLSEKGHDVTWWTSSVNHFTKTFYPESSKQALTLPWGTKLIFLKSILYKKNISLRRLMNHFGTAQHFKKLAPFEPKPDIVICCFPTAELSYAAVKYCQKENIPILIDIRDLYPDVYINLLPRPLKPLGKVLLYPLIWMTKKIMSQATGIIAISQTYLKWGLNHAKREQNKYDGIFPISYPKSEHTPLPDSQFLEKFKGLENKKLVLYVGSFVGSIDLETVIQVARCLQNRGKTDYHFVLAGEGSYREKWEDIAKDLPNVTFTGWVNSHQINWVASRAWVGLGAYKKEALMSLPNKIFEYMSYGLPVLSTLTGETKEFIEENKCGLYYEAGNAEDLLSCLEQLRKEPKKRDSMGQASLKSYENQYSPSRVYGGLIQHAENICFQTYK